MLESFFQRSQTGSILNSMSVLNDCVTPGWGVSCLGDSVLWTSYFILKSNSPLVWGHFPFLVCHWSDVSPDSWLFPPVSPSLMCLIVCVSPYLVVRVFCLVVYLQPWLSAQPQFFAKYSRLYYSDFLNTSEEEWILFCTVFSQLVS